MKLVTRAALAAGCTVVMLGGAVGAAQAGEITGNGTRVHPIHQLPGNSICAYSGQNDEYHEIDTSYPRVQSFGMEVKGARQAGLTGALPVNAGMFCNPNSGGEG